MQKADAYEEATAFVGNGIMFELQNRRQNGTSPEQLIAGEADPFMECGRVKRQVIGAGKNFQQEWPSILSIASLNRRTRTSGVPSRYPLRYISLPPYPLQIPHSSPFEPSTFKL